MKNQLSQSNRTNWRFAGLVARVLVGGLFVITGIAKIANPQTFAQEIQDYQLAPIAITNAMAIILPWLEALAGLLLVLAVWRRETRLLIGLMLVIFTAAKAYALYVLGKSGDCGCGGGVPLLSLILNNPQGLVTNAVLLGLLALDAVAERRCRTHVETPPDAATPTVGDASPVG